MQPATMQMVPMMLYPGNVGGHHHHHSCQQKCKCKKHKKKKKKKKEESDSESDTESDAESEYYYVREPEQQNDNGGGGGGAQKDPVVPVNPYPVNSVGGRRQYSVFAPSHPQAVNQYIGSYSYDMRKKEEPRRYNYDDATNDYMMAAALYEEGLMAGDAALERYMSAQVPPELEPFHEIARPSDAWNEFDDYYCRPSITHPSYYDCVYENYVHNNPYY